MEIKMKPFINQLGKYIDSVNPNVDYYLGKSLFKAVNNQIDLIQKLNQQVGNVYNTKQSKQALHLTIPSYKYPKNIQIWHGLITTAQNYYHKDVSNVNNYLTSKYAGFIYHANRLLNPFVHNTKLYRKSIFSSNRCVLTDSGVNLYRHAKIYLDKFFRKFPLDYHPFIPLQDVLLPLTKAFKFEIKYPSYYNYFGLAVLEYLCHSNAYNEFRMQDNYQLLKISPLTFCAIILSLYDGFLNYLCYPNAKNLIIDTNFNYIVSNLIQLDNEASSLVYSLNHGEKKNN